MSLYSEIKDAFSFHKHAPKKDPATSHRERQLLLVGATVILLIVAILITLATTVAGSSGVQSCKGVILPQSRNDCFVSLASRTGNYSVCSYIPESQVSNGCIASIAQAKDNVTICAKINPSFAAHDSCIENVSISTKNVAYCNQINGTNESSCGFAVAKASEFSSLSYCSGINNNTTKSLCDDVYYYNNAAIEKMPSQCSLIQNITNSTILDIISTKDYLNASASNVTDNNFAALNITLPNFCYYNIAKLQDNKTYCSYTSGTMSSLCYQSFASNSTVNAAINLTNITAECNNSPTYLQGVCLYSVYTEKALAEKNASACLQIQNNTFQSTCIVQLAAKYNDSSYCSYMNTTNSSQEEACYESATVQAR
jgi:hypothetical protein